MKNSVIAMVSLLLLSSCTALKQAGLTGHKPAPQPATQTSSNELKFLTIDMPVEKPNASHIGSSATNHKEEPVRSYSGYTYSSGTPTVESASALQLKYSLLLNTEVEEVRNTRLFEFIDDWYGTRYCMGGTTKNCIDCSAFVQTFFAALYSVPVPRTARDQYRATTRISTTELREGDLLFFNTRGGISHVGIYLQNNKFVHASTSGGVMISDMFEDYWTRKLVGAGRVERISSMVMKTP